MGVSGKRDMDKRQKLINRIKRRSLRKEAAFRKAMVDAMDLMFATAKPVAQQPPKREWYRVREDGSITIIEPGMFCGLQGESLCQSTNTYGHFSGLIV